MFRRFRDFNIPEQLAELDPNDSPIVVVIAKLK